MGVTLTARNCETPQSPAVWNGMPLRMRVLFITTQARPGAWLAEAFAADSASKVQLEEAIGTAAGLTRMRDELFDAVLVSHEPGELDALDLIEGYRAGGTDEPFVVLGTQSDQEMAVLCYEVGADGYVCVNTTTTRNLIWVTARAVQRHQLVRDNHRLNLAEEARLGREHEEADRLLQQQRALVADLESLRGHAISQPNGSTVEAFLPAELIDHYRELLRTYVIMGSGNLGDELGRLARLLVSARMTAGQTMQMHLHVLEELVLGLGERSTRHVMTRADLLVMEVMTHLVEGYRLLYQERIHPQRQMLLPGFE